MRFKVVIAALAVLFFSTYAFSQSRLDVPKFPDSLPGEYHEGLNEDEWQLYSATFRRLRSPWSLQMADSLINLGHKRNSKKAIIFGWKRRLQYYFNNNEPALVDECQKFRSICEELNNYSQYYFSYYIQIKYLLDYGYSTEVIKTLQEMRIKLSNVHDDAAGEAYYYFLNGRNAHYRTDYPSAILSYYKSFEFKDERLDDDFYAVTALDVAKSYFGMFECEKSVDVLEQALKYKTSPIMEKRREMLFCLNYGYMNKKEEFLRHYTLLKSIQALHNKEDMAMINAFYEAFTTGKFTPSLYERDLIYIKQVKLAYYVNRMLGNSDEALKNLETFEKLHYMNLSNASGGDIEYLDALARNMTLQSQNSEMRAREEAQRNHFMIITLIVLVVMIIAIISFSLIVIIIVRRKNRQLVEANQAKTRFLQNMSHEIRTPMNAIVGFAQLLSLPEDMVSTDEKKEYAAYISQNSNILMMLIDDILDIGDIENKQYNIELADTPVNEICRQALKTVEWRVPGGVKSYFTTEVDDSVMIRTDPRRVNQVLVNYLTNACKHTKEGEIHIHLSTSEIPGKIVFSVTDTGCGIPPEEADKIFERFMKLNAFAQGAGLGLHICRTIAERLGGECKLDTSYTNGARFLFIL
ncbi:MAG: HAMP domain-containing histidine kinase [Bacteroidales bacterium]|nr:HAMP domain-containing histidine kinase [Bacteroidales bacterium]